MFLQLLIPNMEICSIVVYTKHYTYTLYINNDSITSLREQALKEEFSEASKK